MPIPQFVSQRSAWASRQQIGYLMQQGVDYPDCLSLAAGLVDYASLPDSLVKQALDAILSDPDRARLALQYGTTQGSLPFRETILNYLASLEGCSRQELQVTADRCLITTGSQQALDLVSQAIFNPGDICLVTAPTYFVYLSTLEGMGVKTVSVNCDEEGLIPAALDQKLENLEKSGDLSRVKMLYLVSYFDNPRGLTLSLERRREVLEILERWSARQAIYLLEDVAYRELWFHSPPPPSMWHLDQSRERVILAQTFSKSLSPGLRTGFCLLPEKLVKPVADLKSIHDFGSPHLTQFVIGDLIRSGAYAQHVAELRTAYHQKSEILWKTLQEELLTQPGMHAVPPAGGLYVWLQMDTHNSRFDGPLFAECAQRQHVMYVPGELFFGDRTHPEAHGSMRLSYGVQGPENLQEGIHRLARGIRSGHSPESRAWR